MTNTPHDALFKYVFSDPANAAAELRAVVSPRLCDALSLGDLERCPGSFIDDALGERRSDLLFATRLGDRPALVYLLFEHQSTVDPDMPFRMLRRLTLFVLKRGRDAPDLADQLAREWGRVVNEVARARAGRRAIEAVVRHILQVNPGATTKRLSRALVGVAGPRMREVVMTAGEKLIEQGRRLGLQAGREEGREEGREVGREEGREVGLLLGRRSLVGRQLALKFGPLPGWAVARLEAAELDTLEVWAERVLFATALEQVFADQP